MSKSEENSRPAFLKPETWRSVTLYESVDAFQNRNKVKANGKEKHIAKFAVYKRDISPLDLYCYLKARFGDPNGYLMIAKTPNDSANLIHWHYHIICDGSEIHFYGKTYHVEVLYQDSYEVTAKDWKLLPGVLKKEYGKWSKEKSNVFKSLEKWRLFVNPYQRILSVVKKLYDEIKLLGSPFELAREQMEECAKKIKDEEGGRANNDMLESNVYELLQKGLALKFLLPILAESFVNLVIFVLLKEDIKKSQSGYETIIRQHITERVTTMPKNCKGFIKDIDHTDVRYKSFQTLMNSRNDFLHGNVDPKKFGFSDVFFDEYTPLFKEPRNIFQHTNESVLRFIETDQIMSDYDVSMSFCEFVLEHIDGFVRQQVDLLVQCADPGWNLKTKRVGVLFPSTPVEMVIPMGDDCFVDIEN